MGWVTRTNLKGPTGTIDEATAIPAPPGATPAVILGGTPARRDMTFVIPRGDKGTPGAPGMHGTDAATGDEAFASYLNTPGSATEAAALAKVGAAVTGKFAPPRLLSPTTQITETHPRFIEYFDGFMWGGLAGDIYRSSDEGGTWELYCNSWPGVGEEAFFNRIIKTSDGEVLVLTGHELRKSSGWANGNAATWSAKLVPNTPTGIFNGFSLDGDGTKFILVEYSPVPESWSDSRYAYISTDAGSTFTMRYDSVAIIGAPNTAVSHLHGTAYDPINDTFYVGEGHGPGGGVYHSTDDGLTWAVAPGMRISEGDGNYNAPTVIVATHDGLVMGSDNTQNGLFGVVRTENPLDQVAVQTVPITTGRAGLTMFAQRGWTDPATGLVYVTFRAEYSDTRPAIAAGTAAGGGIVYEWPTLPSVGGSDRFYIAAITSPNKMTAYAEIGGVPLTVRGSLAAVTPDDGHLRGGVASSASAVAVGTDSAASAVNALAMGKGSKAIHADGIAIGALAEVGGTAGVSVGVASKAGNAGVAVGRGATNGEGGESVALGFNASTVDNYGVAIGTSATVLNANSTAVGHSASAVGAEATAFGAGANAKAGAGTAVGRASEAGNAGTALGRGAKSDSGVALGFGATTGVHDDSVALGIVTTATAAKQIAAGGRHFELVEVATPGPPAANGLRFWAEDNGAGKTRLMVRFATGNPIVLATEL